jgi:DNA polymerase-3 subunit alpha (Gram-positive type)
LVAHNATFDVGFMDVNHRRAGLPTISQPVIDTLEFAQIFIQIISDMVWGLWQRFGVALEHHHMANYDAEATGRLLFIFLRMPLKNIK